jgi:hypothetical protein
MIPSHEKLGRLQQTETTWYREALVHIGKDTMEMMGELDARFDVVDRSWGCTWGFVKNKTLPEMEQSLGKAEHIERDWRGRNLGIKFSNEKYLIEDPPTYPDDLPVVICNVGRCEGMIGDERCYTQPRNGNLCPPCLKRAERIASGKPPRKPPTCSICKEVGHTKTKCSQNPVVIRDKWMQSARNKHWKLYEQDHSYGIPCYDDLLEEYDDMLHAGGDDK